MSSSSSKNKFFNLLEKVLSAKPKCVFLSSLVHLVPVFFKSQLTDCSVLFFSIRKPLGEVVSDAFKGNLDAFKSSLKELELTLPSLEVAELCSLMNALASGSPLATSITRYLKEHGLQAARLARAILRRLLTLLPENEEVVKSLPTEGYALVQVLSDANKMTLLRTYQNLYTSLRLAFGLDRLTPCPTLLLKDTTSFFDIELEFDMYDHWDFMPEARTFAQSICDVFCDTIGDLCEPSALAKQYVSSRASFSTLISWAFFA